MKKNRLRSMIFGVALLTSLGLLAASPTGCAQDISVGAQAEGGSAGPSSFAPTDAAKPDATSSLALCIATTCPAPYETCGGDLRCSTNLSNDPKNCGACGEECPVDFGYQNMTSTCVQGTCEPACASRLIVEGIGNSFVHNFADCNGVLEDGCEVGISTDPNNCGGCGVQCAPGVPCILGKCGCEPGLVACGRKCVDARSDDFNCGACGNSCYAETDAGTPPKNMRNGCVDGKCQLECSAAVWADCDGDQTNGCEGYLGTDPNALGPRHCGACGVQCGPGQECWDTDGDGLPECGGCKPNETECGAGATRSCHDLLNDVHACGSCLGGCEQPNANQTATCKKGVCEVECMPGWADCDLDPYNGCETNLLVSGAHCGACGHRCDTQAGQPCIEGQCAMRECDAGGPR